jgi:lipid A disaccharide synthetase
MTRIGILGINDLTETFLSELFHLYPDANVFLSDWDSERANQLARKFPCWVQDDEQAVINEADAVIITSGTSYSEKKHEMIEYRKAQLVFILEAWPSISSQIISPQTEKKQTSQPGIFHWLIFRHLFI